MKRRNTKQKQEIYSIISGKGHHYTAEQVLELAHEKDPSIGLATVYRNLNLLVDEGKIQRIAGAGFACFDGNPVPHDHFYCTCCGKVQDIAVPVHLELDQEADALHVGEVDHHAILFTGICNDCKKIKEKEQNGTQGI